MNINSDRQEKEFNFNLYQIELEHAFKPCNIYSNKEVKGMVEGFDSC